MGKWGGMEVCPACLGSVYPNNRVSIVINDDGGADDDVNGAGDEYDGGADDDVEGADDDDDDVPCLSWQGLPKQQGEHCDHHDVGANRADEYDANLDEDKEDNCYRDDALLKCKRPLLNRRKEKE